MRTCSLNFLDHIRKAVQNPESLTEPERMQVHAAAEVMKVAFAALCTISVLSAIVSFTALNGPGLAIGLFSSLAFRDLFVISQNLGEKFKTTDELQKGWNIFKNRARHFISTKERNAETLITALLKNTWVFDRLFHNMLVTAFSE